MAGKEDSRVSLSAYNVRISLGTTLLAVKYDGGVVLGAESCVSTYVKPDKTKDTDKDTADNTEDTDKADTDKDTADETIVLDVDTDKIICIAPKIYMGLSGDAHGGSYTLDYVKESLGFRDEQGLPIIVKYAANFAAVGTCRIYPTHATSVIVAGCDNQGCHIYHVSDKGQVTKCENFAMAGSGSDYLPAFLDKEWRQGMNAPEAVDLVVRGISRAIYFDEYSGGNIRTVTINAYGEPEFVVHQPFEYDGTMFSRTRDVSDFINIFKSLDV